MKASVIPVLVALAAIALGAGGRRPAGESPAKPAEPARTYVHKLALGDTIRVAVFGEPDLTQTVRIDGRGQVTLPLIEEIKLGGLTVEQAKSKIEGAYVEGRFLRSPQVTVTVESFTPREITIQGRVRNPQRLALPLESSYTISQAITKCGGLDDIAKGSEVTVRRPMPDGTYKVFVINVDRLLKGKSSAKVEDDFLLEPDDIVYVPERLI